MSKAGLSGVFTYLSGMGLFWFSDLVYRTCRFQIEGLDQLRALRKRNGPVILTSWHGMTMMMAGFFRKVMDASNFFVIIPDDVRGDTLSVLCRKIGTDPYPLDLSGDPSLGLGRELVELVKKVSVGRDILIHPDGPAGPAYKVKPGLSFIARKTGATILPVGCYCRNAYHVPRWDRYTLPLPFSKVHIQLGSLLTVPEDQFDLSVFNRDLEDTLNRLTLQAAANYYEIGD